MQDFCISTYLSINYRIFILKFIVVLLISNALTALINLLSVLNLLNILPCRWAIIKMLFFLIVIILSMSLINLGSQHFSLILQYLYSRFVHLLSIHVISPRSYFANFIYLDGFIRIRLYELK